MRKPVHESTFPQTHTSPLKIGPFDAPKRKRPQNSNHPFSGANWLLVSALITKNFVRYLKWRNPEPYKANLGVGFPLHKSSIQLI